MELQGKFENNLAYSGIVDVTVKSGDIVRKKMTVHNAGTKDICRYLCNALIGRETSVYAPRNIVACFKVGNELQEMFTIGYPYAKKGIGEPGENSCTASFSFIIPWTVLNTNQKIAGFHLKNNANELLAEVTLEDEIGIDQYTNIEVTWTLIVSAK